MGFLDGTVVNVAIKRIGTDIGASLADLQWVVNGYLLMLAALILVGGSLGDRFGRKRLFLIGVIWFAVASAVCGLANSPAVLIGARVVQGIGAAMLTPGSLSMIQGAFVREDRARAIGTWSGLAGVTTALGPLVGGWLVQTASWRYVFWINIPLAAIVIAIGVHHIPETSDPQASHHLDLPGVVLGAVGLGAVTYALIEAGTRSSAEVAVAAVVGVLALTAFVLVERHGREPLVPPSIFSSRVFLFSNVLTFVVYGALGALMFMLVLQLQVVTGWTPLEAGLSTLPVTVLMLLFSGRSAALSARIGPRTQMTAGPVVCGLGALLLSRVGAGESYWLGVLPGVVLFGIGLTLMVAPLTATVMAAAEDRYAGTASGVNNAIARAGSLLAVAALPALVGLSGADYAKPAVFGNGFTSSMYICAALLFAGGIAGWMALRPTGPGAAPSPSPPR